MKYKDLMGFQEPKKKVVKEKPKPKVNQVLEGIKDEFGLNEGPSYEYANYMKKIEKAENIQAKEVNKFVQLLMKKGLKKEATTIASKYVKSAAEFDNLLKIIYGKLT